MAPQYYKRGGLAPPIISPYNDMLQYNNLKHLSCSTILHINTPSRGGGALINAIKDIITSYHGLSLVIYTPQGCRHQGGFGGFNPPRF